MEQMALGARQMGIDAALVLYLQAPSLLLILMTDGRTVEFTETHVRRAGLRD